MANPPKSLYDKALMRQAAWDAIKRLSPLAQVKNPVMFVVWLGSVLCTGLAVQALVQRGEEPAWFVTAITLWLWFTVLFANFAEAMAEGRGKAQAAALKGLKKTVFAKKLTEPRYGATVVQTQSQELRKGDVVLIEAGDTVPGDGEVIEGVCACYPRIGRRLLRGDGRHARAV